MSNADHDPLPIDQIPVGEILGRELEARGWSQADFATVLGRPTQFVSELVTGKKEITRESAAQIAAALDHTAEYWLQLQDQYLLSEQGKNPATQDRLDEVRRRARLNRKGPIQLLQKRKVLKSTTLDDLEAEVRELYELDSLDDEPGFAAAAKRGNQDENISTLQRAWVACVRQKARQLPPEKEYSARRLKKLAGSLPGSLMVSDDFVNLPLAFANAGVRLVYVEMLPGGKIDGCAMFVDGYPVIGLSGRGKRLDKVLFALLHEIAHILLAHVDSDRLIVENLDDIHESEKEREDAANADAANWVFPHGFPAAPAKISGPWVDQTAATLEVARIVVIGQLQHRKRLDWRTTLAKNAPTADAALNSWD